MYRLNIPLHIPSVFNGYPTAPIAAPTVDVLTPPNDLRPKNLCNLLSTSQMSEEDNSSISIISDLLLSGAESAATIKKNKESKKWSEKLHKAITSDCNLFRTLHISLCLP